MSFFMFSEILKIREAVLCLDSAPNYLSGALSKRDVSSSSKVGPGLKTKRRQRASAATYSLEMKAGAIMHAKTIKKTGSSFYPFFTYIVRC